MCHTDSIAKQELHQLDSYATQEPSAKNLRQHTGMTASHLQLPVPYVAPVPQFWFVNPNHQKHEECEDVLHRSGRFLPLKLSAFFLNVTPKAISSLQPLISGHKFLNTYDRRNGVGKPVFNFAPLGHEQRFNVIVMAALCLLAFSPLGGSRALFFSAVLLFGGFCKLHFIYADANP